MLEQDVLLYLNNKHKEITRSMANILGMVPAPDPLSVEIKKLFASGITGTNPPVILMCDLEIEPYPTNMARLFMPEFTLAHETGHHFHHLLNPILKDEYLELRFRERKGNKYNKREDLLLTLNEEVAEYFALLYFDRTFGLEKALKAYNGILKPRDSSLELYRDSLREENQLEFYKTMIRASFEEARKLPLIGREIRKTEKYIEEHPADYSE